MSKWNYFVRVGSPGAFYIACLELPNLSELERAIEMSVAEIKYADPDATFPWLPGSRKDDKTGYNGSIINSRFFTVSIHRYREGAEEIDLGSRSCVKAYLFCRGEGRTYGEEWQVVELNNPKSWVRSTAAAHERFVEALEDWNAWYFYAPQSGHTVLDGDFIAAVHDRERFEDAEDHAGISSQLDLFGSYGGTH